MQPSEAQQAKAAALVPEKHRRAARAAIATALAEEAARVRRECWQIAGQRAWRIRDAIAASGPMAEPERGK